MCSCYTGHNDKCCPYQCHGCSKTHRGIGSCSCSCSLACLKPVIDLWNEKLISMHFHICETFILWLCPNKCICDNYTSDIPDFCKMRIVTILKHQYSGWLQSLENWCQKTGTFGKNFGCSHKMNLNKNNTFSCLPHKVNAMLNKATPWLIFNGKLIMMRTNFNFFLIFFFRLWCIANWIQ